MEPAPFSSFTVDIFRLAAKSDFAISGKAEMCKMLLASFTILAVSSAATVAGDDAKRIAQVFPSNQEGTSQLLPNQNIRRLTRCPPFREYR